MALRAGYYGLKRKLIDKLTSVAGSYDTLSNNVTALITGMDSIKFKVLFVDAPAAVNTNKDVDLDTLLSGKTYFVVGALFEHASNHGFYSLLSSEGSATIAYNKSLRLNVASSNFIGGKVKVLIAYSAETYIPPESKIIYETDPETEEPLVVKKSTRKTTKKTEEEE